MNISNIAKQLGRRGGLKRAANLSPQQRRDISLMGAKARAESYALAKRIETNFRYVEAMLDLAPQPRVQRHKTCRHSLPRING